jgi:hypothetical protein
MPPLCKVCAHPKRKEIDGMLLDGVSSLRGVGAKFGFGAQALHRHKVNHMGWRPAVDEAERRAKEEKKREQFAAPSRVAYLESKLPTREELGATLEDVVARLDAIVTKHEGADDGNDVIKLKGLGEMRSTVSELAKLAGHIGGGAAQTLNIGVAVSVSAADVAAELSRRLGTVPRSDVRDAIVADYTCEAVGE